MVTEGKTGAGDPLLEMHTGNLPLLIALHLADSDQIASFGACEGRALSVVIFLRHIAGCREAPV